MACQQISMSEHNHLPNITYRIRVGERSGMHVGKGIFLQNLSGQAPDGDVVAHEMALADQAEGLGFESLWAAEHHFSGYHMCPSVTQILTYLAARTSTVRLGSMVVVLPWHE